MSRRPSFNDDVEGDWTPTKSSRTPPRNSRLNQSQRNGSSPAAATKSPRRDSSNQSPQNRGKKDSPQLKPILKKSSNFLPKQRFSPRPVERRASYGNDEDGVDSDSSYKNPTRRDSLSARKKKPRRRCQSTPRNRRNLINNFDQSFGSAKRNLLNNSNRSLGNVGRTFANHSNQSSRHMSHVSDGNESDDESSVLYDVPYDHSYYNRSPSNGHARDENGLIILSIPEQMEILRQIRFLQNPQGVGNPIENPDGEDDVIEDNEAAYSLDTSASSSNESPPRWTFQFVPDGVDVEGEVDFEDFFPREEDEDDDEALPEPLLAIMRAQNNNDPGRPLTIGEALFPSAYIPPLPESPRRSLNLCSDERNSPHRFNVSQRLFELDDSYLDDSMGSASNLSFGSRNGSYNYGNNGHSEFGAYHFSNFISNTEDWGEQVTPVSTRPTLNADQIAALEPATASPILKIDPKDGFVKAKGGTSNRQLQNSSNSRLAYKVYSSNNEHYRVHPVYGFVEPNAVSMLKIVRYNGPVNGKAEFCVDFCKVSADEKDAKGVFEKGLSEPGDWLSMSVTAIE